MAIVTALILVQFVVFGLLVGRARFTYRIKAPATTGDPVFERYFRAHQNTLEQMVVVLPALWMFGYYVHALAGAGLGVVYLIARTLYFRAYVADAAKRSAGFGMGIIPAAILLLGGLGGAAWHWLRNL